MNLTFFIIIVSCVCFLLWKRNLLLWLNSIYRLLAILCILLCHVSVLLFVSYSAKSYYWNRILRNSVKPLHLEYYLYQCNQILLDCCFMLPPLPYGIEWLAKQLIIFICLYFLFCRRQGFFGRASLRQEIETEELLYCRKGQVWCQEEEHANLYFLDNGKIIRLHPPRQGGIRPTLLQAIATTLQHN